MTRRLLASYLSITLFVLVALVYPLGATFAAREREQLVADIERDAVVFASLAEDDLENGVQALPGLHTTVGDYLAGGVRVVIVDAAGISVLDSDSLDGVRRDFSTRPEFVLALSGERSTGTRPSADLGGDILFVAVPISSGGALHGAVRITVPTSTMDARIRAVWLQLGLLSVVVMVAVAAVGFFLARSVTRPVRELQLGAEALARGQLDQRVPADEGAPELRALAATFNHTAERLQRLVDGQRTFVADASHQLRSPLTALRLRLETIGGDPDGTDQAKLDAAVNEVDRLSRMVDGLLVLARAGESRPGTVALDLAELVAERADHWAPICRARRVELETGGDPGSLVRAIPGTLDLVVDNLIDNALAASPDGATVQVLVRAATGADEVAIHVLDQGPGMTGEERARAFDRFWRAPGNTRRGSGLGLAIVADLMAANGGRAELTSAPGGGLDAIVVMPTSGVAPGEGPSVEAGAPLTFP